MYNTIVWYKCLGATYVNNRDALLLAAKKCLLEKGYNRTTARDIASVAGVSLAAIGYHFSSKEALLTEALLLAFGEWDQDLQQALRTAVSSHVSPAERFEAIWAKIIATFETHRSLWIANFEIFAQMVSQPETRKIVAGKLHLARAGLAALFLNQDESTIDNTSGLSAPSTMCFSPDSSSNGSSIPPVRYQPKILPKPCAARPRICSHRGRRPDPNGDVGPSSQRDGKVHEWIARHAHDG